MKLAGIKWTCSNEKLIETKFASLQENIGKLTSLQLKAKSPKLYNMAINMTESYKKDQIKGIYDCFVAFEVVNFDNLPKEVYQYDFKGGKYKVFTTDKGQMQTVVFNKWVQIWNDSSLNNNERSYIADWDVYTGQEDYNNAQIEIYIGIK